MYGYSFSFVKFAEALDSGTFSVRPLRRVSNPFVKFIHDVPSRVTLRSPPERPIETGPDRVSGPCFRDLRSGGWSESDDRGFRILESRDEWVEVG